jgi:hypothetical protein
MYGSISIRGSEDRSSKGRVDETRFFGSRKETEAKENLTYPSLAGTIAMAFWGDDICSTVVNYEYKCI